MFISFKMLDAFEVFSFPAGSKNTDVSGPYHQRQSMVSLIPQNMFTDDLALAGVTNIVSKITCSPNQ